MSGYTIVAAESIEAALQMAKACPFLDIGGSLEVSKLMQMPSINYNGKHWGNTMSDKNAGGVHWSFWVISVVTLIFNAMGVINYFVQMNADSLTSFPESYRPIIEGRPAWATAAFAIAVFGGSLGCLLLLLRKSAAFYVFIASLLSVIVTMVHIFGVAGLSPFDIWIGVLMQLVVTAFLVWYAKHTESKGWII